jgi:TOMM system kinase/cyclase fusion protein
MDQLRDSSETNSSSLAVALEHRYRLLHSLGSGSGGHVHKAVQISTGQIVAVKVLDVSESDTSVADRRIERFRREIAICSTLYHPDIVRLVDSGELNAYTQFAVFEYIPGTTLAELLREEGMLTVRRAKRLMTQLLSPLAHAHANGIAHRDLKPSNIMVMQDGVSERVKILDFGISVATERKELPRLTLSHEWVGTPAYAAPEQLRGEPANAKSDLYAWGLMFLECLTGVAAIGGKWLVDIIEQQLRPIPHTLPERLSLHRLGALLSRVLEKDPTRRPQDARQLLTMLERISTDDLEDQRGYLRDSQSLPPATPRLSDTITDGKLDVHVERRRATVVCAKVTPAGPNEGTDVEQVDQALDDANAFVLEVLEQYGARSPQSLGAYSLAYFGLKQSRDPDARVAMRAALELVTRFEKSPRALAQYGISLRLHVGIHHGPVLVRQSRESRQQVNGLTARVAMELTEISGDRDGGAAPILVTEEFRQLVVRYAEFAATGREYATQIPWLNEPVRAYSLSGESRFAASSDMLSELVGRANELAELYRSWSRRTEYGEAIVLIGEAGIGKSRLGAELRQRLEQEGVEWIEARCLPEWQNAFLRPLANMFLQLFGLNGFTPAEAGANLEEQLRELGVQTTDSVPLFCVWLSLPLPKGHAPLAWSPQKQRQLLHQRLAETLIARMQRGSVVMIEDLHWADPTTLEFVDVLLRLVPKRGCLVLLTTRPCPAYPWSVPPREITLNRLDDASARALAATLLRVEGTGDASVAQIAERSDGVPLFLEELALTVRNLLVENHASTQEGRPKRRALASIPASLRDLLTSRLEGIGASRRIAEFAAALGREFSFDLLCALSGEDEFALLSDIEQLVSEEILVKQMRVDGPMYSFRHALIRDAVYDEMQEARRVAVHRQIAMAIEARFPGLTDAEPDVLARHWEGAEVPEAAIRYWHIAAQRSGLASAHDEALDQIDRGLALLHELPESPERRAHEAELLLTRGTTVVAKRGYTAPEAASHFSRVLSLLPETPDTTEAHFAARWGLWYFNNTRAAFDRAQELALALRSSADATKSPRMSVCAWEAICETRFYLGDLAGAVEASRHCESEYDFDNHRNLASLRGDDPHLASLSFEAIAEMARGRIASGLHRVEQALELADRLGYPTMKAAMHCQAARVFMIWGASGASQVNLIRARQHTSEALALCREHGFQFWDAYGRAIDAAAAIAEGDVTAVQLLRDAADRWNAIGARLGRCWHLSFVSEALRRLEQFDAAAAALDEALGFCVATRSRFYEAEVRRRRAQLLLDPRYGAFDPAAASDEFDRASAVADSCGAHWWSLATAVCRMRAAPDGSREQHAHEVRRRLDRCELGGVETPPLVTEAEALLSAS